MKRFGLRKRSAKPRQLQFQRACILERLEERTLMAVIAAGDEFLVNPAVYGSQQVAPTSPSVAVNAEGDFLVTYDGFGNGDRSGVFVRRFDSSGAPLGESILANITISGKQQDASSALADNGDFVVVWSGFGPGDATGIFARRFTSSGNSGEIAVNQTVGGKQDAAAIAMAADGSFVVVWSGTGGGDNQGILMRRFSAAGAPVSDEVRVNTTTFLTQKDPSVSMADDGSFVVTWASQLQDGSGWGVFAQRFNNQGVAQGSEFLVNTTTAGDQLSPQAAMAPDGRFVIAWTGLDGSGDGVFAQQYDAAGGKVGTEVLVNTTTSGNQFDPHVATNVRGDFTVSWTSVEANGGGFGVVGQNFSAQGLRDGGEYSVNGLVTGHQHNASVGADDLGNLVFVYNGMGGGDGRGVLARRFVPDSDVLGPVITASLANDTGLFNNDRITQDPAINANVNDQSIVTRLQASLQNLTQNEAVPALMDVAIPANFRGPITLSRAQLEQLRGGTMPDGEYRLRLQATDAEGNVSSVLEFNFTLDTISPLPPTMFDLLAADDTGSSNTDNLTNNLRPRIQVAAVSGQLVQLFVDGNFVNQALAPTSGFTVIASGFDIGTGAHVYTARAIDAAGNHSIISTESLTVTTDTTPPDGSAGTPDLLDSSDSGISQTDNLTNDNTPTFRIATQTGDRVRLLASGVIVAEGVATGATIELTPTTAIADGTQNFTAVLTDEAGNASAPSAALSVTIDTAAPSAPTALQLLDSSDTGNDVGDGVTRDTTPTIRVTATPGVTVRLNRGGTTPVGQGTTGTGSTVDITTSPLEEGAHTLTAVAIDDAGNAGAPASQQLQVVVDSLRIDLVESSDTGIGTQGKADNLTNQNLATLQVTAPPMSTVSITIDGNPGGTQTADANGIATFVTPLLSDGVHIIRATAVDGSITRGPSAALVVTVDTSAPTVVTPIGDVTAQQDAANTNVPLSGLFTDIDSLGTVVRFNTVAGVADVQLYPNAAPLHVQNFLNYVNRGDYNGTIFHRVVPGFVAQGGQQTTTGGIINTDPPVQNEFLVSASLGTLQLAKLGGNPNSGTSQFFFNLDDNSDNLNNQNGGFTAFGQTLGDGIDIIDNIPQNGVINSVTVLPAGDRVLTFTATSNNAALVTASIVNNNVVLDYQPGQTGTAEITVRASDLTGNFVEDTFTVTVNPSGPLMSAGASGGTLDAAALAALPSAELSPEMAAVVAEAVRRWTTVGLDGAAAQSLENVSVRLADLPEGYLGYALADTIWLDSDADGQGWFVDPTAGDDEEFALDIAGRWQANADDAIGRVDLLSVAAHEFGHLLGLDHHDGDASLMADTLPAGVRQLPTADLVDALLSDEQ